MFCGRLVGHNGAVSALTLSNDTVVTGARDRLIKLYNLAATPTGSGSQPTGSGSQPTGSSSQPTGSSSQPSVCTLYPPHYDAVSALTVHDNRLLFSACAVTIKQWDIVGHTLKQVRLCVCVFQLNMMNDN